MKPLMFSKEFLERFTGGQKVFDGISLQYADFSGKNLSGLHLKNADLFFTSCRNCNFEDAVFENCNMFFAGFRGSNFRNVKIINSQIEYSGLSVICHNTKIINSKISWTDMLDTNMGEVEMRNCQEFRVFRNISEITASMADQAMKNLHPAIQHLDFDMQEKVMKLIGVLQEKYNVQIDTKSATPESAYQTPRSGAMNRYKFFDALLDNAIIMYGQKPAYKTKNIYERKHQYKKVK
jgi:hypothetical protein